MKGLTSPEIFKQLDKEFPEVGITNIKRLISRFNRQMIDISFRKSDVQIGSRVAVVTAKSRPEPYDDSIKKERRHKNLKFKK